MKLELEGTTVDFYDDCDEITADRYHHFKYHLTLWMGIDTDNLPNHFLSLSRYIQNDRKEDAIKELYNIQMAFFMALSEHDQANLALGHLIKSIDGKPIDYGSDALLEQVADLGKKGLSHGKVKEIIGSVKKKLIPNLKGET